MKWWRLKLTLFFSLLFGLVMVLPPLTALADFNHNNIMDDYVFDRINMTAEQIDSFLNSNFPNSCISTNSSFAARLPTGYSPSGGFTFGDFATAGQVIAQAANIYGINPQVLIVTMQKEQSIVAGSSGTFCNDGNENKYAAAMGYGCPDGGTTYNYSGVSLYRRFGVEHTVSGPTCVNSSAKAGFSQQVIRAAWLLKFGEQRSEGNTSWNVQKPGWNNSDDPQTCYGGPMTQGSFKRCSTDANPTYYDGYITIDGQSTHMDTGATAALYWYTPHFSGNQNFDSIFTQWFGVPYKPDYAWQPVSTTIYSADRGAQITTDHLKTGERVYVVLAAKNIGNQTWFRDGANPTLLGTDRPRDGQSYFCDSTWPSCNRAAKLTEVQVAPGDTGHFEFYAAAWNGPGQWWQYFTPVLEHQTWMANDAGYNLYMSSSLYYNWSWNSFDAWTDQSKTTPVDINNLGRNQTIYIVLRAINTSSTVWYNSGSHPTKLATSDPQDRMSSVCTNTWLSCNRLALMNEASVSPGQTATFSFTLKTPGQLGIDREFVRPVLEYDAWTLDDMHHIYLNVTH